MTAELEVLQILRPIGPAAGADPPGAELAAASARTRHDAELLAAWRTGDRECGDALFRRHLASVRGFLARRAAAADVSDLVQLTFEACLHAQSQYRGEGRFVSYLLAIARTQLHRWRRRRDPTHDAESPTSLRACGDPPGDIVERRERDVLVRECLRRIPSEMQALLELHYWQDLEVAEVAAVLGIRPGAVRGRLFRARAKLRAELDARLRDAEPVPHPPAVRADDRRSWEPA